MDEPFPSGMVDEIQRILELDLPVGQVIYEEVFASPLMFPLQRKGEMRRMLEIAARIEPKTVMEIGADKGGSIYHWCQLPTVDHVIGCEIRGVPYGPLFDEYMGDHDYLWLPCSSEEAWQHVKGWELPIDVLFIDGDKSRFYEDFQLYKPLMNPNGIVFLHDVHDRGSSPRKAFTLLQRDHRSEEIYDTTDLQELRNKKPGEVWTQHDYWLDYWKGRSCGVGVIYLGAK